MVLLLASCRKEESASYSISGKVTDADDNTPLTEVQVEVEKQVVQNGIFGNTYQRALITATNNNGEYQGSWPRENFAALRILTELENYIAAEISLDIDAFEGGQTVRQDIALHKEAFASLRFLHNGGNVSDRLSFTFLKANFKCSCFSNGWKTWQSAQIDTTFTCRVYGNRWLKYQVQTQFGFTDSTFVDSIYCVAFDTTSRAIQY
ncbi:MAG: hypothetical protein ACK5BL_10430 [Flavobacteriales bacterium]